MKRSSSIFGFILMAAFFLTAGSAWASDLSCSEELARQMSVAASTAGVEINLDQLVVSSKQDLTVAATTIQGYEQIPATALPKGVNAGFLYLDVPNSGIEKGFYTVRASAREEDVQIGEFEGTVELISVDGKVAAVLPAKMDAFSLTVPTVPSGKALPRSTAEVTPRRRWNENYVIIDYWCPNGSHFVFVIFFDPFWP